MRASMRHSRSFALAFSVATRALLCAKMPACPSTIFLYKDDYSMKYSIIVPVFNRPDEVDELLNSLASQEDPSFPAG